MSYTKNKKRINSKFPTTIIYSIHTWDCRRLKKSHKILSNCKSYMFLSCNTGERKIAFLLKLLIFSSQELCICIYYKSPCNTQSIHSEIDHATAGNRLTISQYFFLQTVFNECWAQTDWTNFFSPAHMVARILTRYVLSGIIQISLT